MWLGPERPASVVEAIRRGGGVETAIEEANAIVWSNLKDPVTRLQRLLHPGIEWVQVDSAGVEHWIASGLVDETRLWTSATGRYGPAVAEHVVTLLLACSRRIVEQVRVGHWARMENEILRGKTVGFLGGGSIARESIARLTSFGVRCVALCEPRIDVPGAEHTYGSEGLYELLEASNHVVVALPLTPATRGLIGRRELELIGDGLLINVARGAIVDTDALVEVLAEGRLGGAGLDVTDPEPLPADHPLWQVNNVLITSHSANSIEMMNAAYAELVAENIGRFRRGDQLLGVIDLTLGY
jgi:D-3-phosphoglycerate dehydrogenase